MKRRTGFTIAVVIYVALGVAGFVVNQRRGVPPPQPPRPPTPKKTMRDSLDWPLALPTVKVLARPVTPWLLVHEFVKGPALIKIEARGTWYLSERAGCSADGEFLTSMKSQGCLLDSAPEGALVAKIGGSSAGVADGKVFLAGSFTVYQIGADVSGPLYLTINDAPSCLADNRGFLEVDVHIRKLPEPATPPK